MEYRFTWTLIHDLSVMNINEAMNKMHPIKAPAKDLICCLPIDQALVIIAPVNVEIPFQKKMLTQLATEICVAIVHCTKVLMIY